MQRFLISGSSRFNNYFLFSKYIKDYMPKDAIMVTCGGDYGTDAMSREYSARNNILLEEYPVSSPDKDSVVNRNHQIMGYVKSAVIFDDGRPGTVEHIKNTLMRSRKSVVVVEITPNDNIDCNIDCSEAYLKDYFNISRMSEYTMHNLADAVLAVLGKEEILQHILDAKETDFFKSDSVNMAAGFSYWMKHNELPYLRQRLRHEERRKPETCHVSLEELISIWNQKQHPAPVVTSEGLPVLTDFEDTVVDGRQLWLQANDNQVIKNNLWQTHEQMLDEESEPINSRYETKDTSDTRVFYRNTEFDASPFKSGYWYFDTKTLK